MERDVTDQVVFGGPDEELLPLEQCVCGKAFAGWDNCLRMENDEDIHICPHCGAKLYWRIRVFQVE